MTADTFKGLLVIAAVLVALALLAGLSPEPVRYDHNGDPIIPCNSYASSADCEQYQSP